MKIRISYRRARVTVELPEGTEIRCEVCGKTGRTEFHHYKYAYRTSEVRRNPQLALHHTIMLDFSHHILADAVRKIAGNMEDAHKIIKLMKRKEADASHGGG